MNAKENAREIISFGTPERVLNEIPAHRIAYRGCNHEGYQGGGHHLPIGSRWTDIWGTEWHREHTGVMGFPRGNPLADLAADLRFFQWPDPDDERICGWISEQAKGWDRETEFLSGSHRDTLWEKSYMLAGMENMMCSFYTEPEAVRELLHRIMDFQLGIAQHYLGVGVEMVGMGDDLGTQRGPLISPRIVREFFLPEYGRLFDLYKQHGVIVHFHSCGHIIPLLDVFLDLGVDILNPIQASANDLDALRRATQGKMALNGGVSSATIVAGPIEAIRDEVAQRIWQLGRDGGYFCGPDQGMPWPDAHIAALHEAVAELGRYPLQPPLKEQT